MKKELTKKGSLTLGQGVGYALGMIGLVLGVVILISIVINVYPTFSASMLSLNTSGITFAGVSYTVGILLFGAAVMLAIILMILKMIKNK